MIVTCPACQSDYRLDPGLLPSHGRKVRCTTCLHIWRQDADGRQHALEDDTAAPRPKKQAPPPAMDDDDLMGVLEETEDDDAGEQGDTGEEELIGAPPEGEELIAGSSEPFEIILRRTADSVAPSSPIPEAVMPDGMDTPKAAVYTPMGMGEVQFGALTFLLCTFMTLSVLFLAKGFVVDIWPPASLLYKRIGFDVPAPGEGLRIGRLTAEIQVDKSRRVLVIEGQLTNMTREEQAYPSLLVTVDSAYGAELKSWTLDNAGVNPLAPGKGVPLKLEFENPPDGAADVEVKVVKP